MTVRSVRTLEEIFLRDDGRVSADEARVLFEAARDRHGVSADERT